MAEPIPDAAIVAVLRPFVRASRPVLDGLRDADAFGLRHRAASAAPVSGRAAAGRAPAAGAAADSAGSDRAAAGRAAADGAAADGGDRQLRERLLDALAAVRVPGTAGWVAMDVAARCRWWIYRVGRVTTVAAAVPGLGGALARTLPVSAALGLAGQGLLLCAIAGEHGIDDEETVVAMLASVLFDRALTVRRLDAAADAAVDEKAEELTGDLRDGQGRSTVRRVATALWRLGRALYAVEGELDKRPHGRFYHEAIGLLPGVGAVGKYLGEWSGLKRASKQAHRWLARRAGSAHPGTR
ncbi:hypothetical protein [Pseudonocardia dioxanivorans]|uniref:hypothetical protein n=1 Tax=Pseudonocardia dioxanivorans TaxID=240495 RepID=UPI000CD22A47|nr:hypothetical protein [Pseudonocardia dioxanivorans]